MIHTLKRDLTDIGGALIPDAKRLGLFADTNGNWYAVDSLGFPKLLGNGIETIEKTGTEGAVDTYTITRTNGTQSIFTVTNGSVTSVNGKTGDAVLSTDDVDEGQDNLYLTPERIDPLNLTAVEGSHPEPMADKIRIFGQKTANRIMASSIGPRGQPIRFQPHLGTSRLSLWLPNGANNATRERYGGIWGQSAMGGVPITDTPKGRIRRGLANAVNAGGQWNCFTDEANEPTNAYGRPTGFHFIGHWGPHTTMLGRRFFVGLARIGFGNVVLSGVDCVGLQADTGEEFYSVRGYDGQTTLTSMSAVDTNAWYRFELFCPSQGNAIAPSDVIGWQIMNMVTGDFETGDFTGVQLSPPDQFMHARCTLIGTAGGTHQVHVGSFSVETDL